MTAQQPSSFREWFQALPLPWLVSGPVGSQDAAAQGIVLDARVALVKLATKAHMPDYAPTDALAHIGGDRQLEQGATESNANFIIRLKTAWDDWARAGSPVELLTQLYWGGFPGAMLVQQNGLMFSLSGAPTAGIDPTPLLTITNAGPHATKTGHPAWWTFDGNDAFGSRFAVLFPTSGGAFTTSGTALFTGVEDGSTAHPWPTVTWNNPFSDTTYKIQVGMPVVTDGIGPVICNADNASKTPTAVRVAASASFTGSVDVLAWQAGANPYADLHFNDLQRLRRLIARWKPGKALCMGIYARTQGHYWGEPGFLWGAAGVTWGSSNVVFYGA